MFDDSYDNALFLDTEFVAEATVDLTDAEMGRLIRAMLFYQGTGTHPSLSGKVKSIYLYIMPKVMADSERERARIRERKEKAACRHYPEYREWRKAVFERDGYICQRCGQVGGQLNAHHIKQYAYYPELRLDLDNGITLCVNCHKFVHRKKNRVCQTEY